MMRPARTLLPLALLAACSAPEDRAAKARLASRTEVRPTITAFDWAQPQAAFRIGAEGAAGRLGSFEWTAAVSWTVGRSGDPPARIQASEHHRVRQLSSGEFEVESVVDPGRGAGSESGKHVVYVDKMTYARSLYAPFGAFRERPTDRGRDARRYRDESFGLAADIADLFGGRLELRPAGDGSFLSRAAKRFTFALTSPQAEPVRRPGPSNESPTADEDTKKRLAFLDGHVPTRASGECLLEAETGVPLKLTLRGTFEVKDAPGARVEVELAAQMRTLGSATPPVARPRDVLPDERKPKGVARALEAAGLKKRGGAEMGREEPAEEE